MVNLVTRPSTRPPHLSPSTSSCLIGPLTLLWLFLSHLKQVNRGQQTSSRCRILMNSTKLCRCLPTGAAHWRTYIHTVVLDSRPMALRMKTTSSTKPEVHNVSNSCTLSPIGLNGRNDVLYSTRAWKVNRLFKYADDTTVLVPSDSDVGLEDEFENVKQWAKDNKMILGLILTKPRRLSLGAQTQDCLSTQVHNPILNRSRLQSC